MNNNRAFCLQLAHFFTDSYNMRAQGAGQVIPVQAVACLQLVAENQIADCISDGPLDIGLFDER